MDHIRQPSFVAIETGDHRRKHFFRFQFLDLERVARMVGQQGEESQLRPAVSFAEGMDGIQLCQEMRGFLCECLRIEIPEVVVQSQVIEQPSGLALNVFGKAEWIAAFRYPTVRTCPAQ
jgi:hypothetical protein